MQGERSKHAVTAFRCRAQTNRHGQSSQKSNRGSGKWRTAEPNDAQALWYVAPGQAELREEKLAAPGQGEVRLRARYSAALSRGTEALVLAGRVPPSEFERMRRAVHGRRLPVSGEIRLRRPSAGSRTGPAELAGRNGLRPATRIRACSMSRPSAVVPVPEGVPPSGRCWPPIWRPRLTRSGMPRRDRPSGSRWSAAAWSAPWSPTSAPGLPGAEVTLGRYQSGAGGIGAAARRRLCQAGGGAGRLRSGGSRQRDGGRACHRACGLPAFEATVLELSWYGDGRGAGAARRRVPQPPPAADRKPGRPGRAVAPPRLDAPSPADRSRGAAGRSTVSMHCWRRQWPLPTCRRGYPDILAPKSGVLCQVI